MSFRFRRTLTLIPGLLRIGLNRKSASVSFGPKGAGVTYNTRRQRTAHLDLPAGWSWRTTRSTRRRRGGSR